MINVDIFKTLKMGVTNCYLLKCRDGYLLIDTSFPEYFGKFLEELKRIEVDPLEIKYLLLTHHHDDHAGFAARLKEISGCRIIIHNNAIAALRDGVMISTNKPLNWRVNITMAIFNKVKHRNFKIPPVTIDNSDLIINGEEDNIVKQIGLNGKILYTPGHTVDSISVVLSNGDAFVGDTCMNFLNFCGIHYRPIWLYNQELVFNSWTQIIDSGARIIYPAHGKHFNVTELIKYKNIYANKINPI